MAVASSLPVAFDADDALCRLRRVQATCASLGVDGLLFVGGRDGRENLGSVHALNYLLAGVSGHDLLERQRLAAQWLEDAVVFVRPDRCAIHVAPDAYAELRRVVARWPRVTVRCLPPRRDEDLLRSESEEARRRRRRVAAEAPSDESDDGADDERAAAEDESSDGDPEEDLREAFKLESFVDFVAGAEVVGVPCTPPARSKFTRPERYLASAADGKAPPPLRRRDPPGMELEKWPLVQAYGLDGVGRDGFFTMTRAVVDAWSALRERCYFRADRASLARVLRDALPAFEQHWRDVLEHFERTSATHRARLDAEGALAPLADFFEFGALRALPHGPLRTPEEEAARRPKLTFHAHEADPTRRTHFTLEGAHPKAPEIRCARTYLLCNAADEAAKAAGFRVGRRTRRGGDAGDGEAADEAGNARGGDAARLSALYAGAVAAGRAAMRAACSLSEERKESEEESAEEASEAFFDRVARLACARTARDAGFERADVSVRDAFRVDVHAVTPEGGVRAWTRADAAGGRGVGVVRVEVRDDGASGASGRVVAYGDAFVPAGPGASGERSKSDEASSPHSPRSPHSPPFLVLTDAIPLFAAWPAEGGESAAIDAATRCVAKAARDAARWTREFTAKGGRAEARRDKDTRSSSGAGFSSDGDPLATATPTVPTVPTVSPRDDPVVGVGEKENDAPRGEAAFSADAFSDAAAFLDDELLDASEDPEDPPVVGFATLATRENRFESESSAPRRGDSGDDSGDDSDDAYGDAFSARNPDGFVLPPPLTLGPRLLMRAPVPALAFRDVVPARTRESERGAEEEEAEEEEEEALETTRSREARGDVHGGAGVDGFVRGELWVFENGVAFCSRHAAPAALVVGANVESVSVAPLEANGGDPSPGDPSLSHPDASLAASFRVRVETTLPAREEDEEETPGRRLRSPAVGSVASPADALDGAWRFSLAPATKAQRRAFFRSVAPRWRKPPRASEEEEEPGGGGAEGMIREADARESPSVPATPAAATARALRAASHNAALQRGSLAAAVPGARPDVSPTEAYRTLAADARVDAAARFAADATSGVFAREKASFFAKKKKTPKSTNDAVEPGDPRVAAKSTQKSSTESAATTVTVVPVTLLVGPPGSCQEDVARAIRRGAADAATWVVARTRRVVDGCDADALADAMVTVAARIRAARGRGSHASEVCASDRVRAGAESESERRVERRAPPPPPARALLLTRSLASAEATRVAATRAVRVANARLRRAEETRELSEGVFTSEDAASEDASGSLARTAKKPGCDGSSFRFRLAGITACVSPECVFAEGERRPCFDALACVGAGVGAVVSARAETGWDPEGEEDDFENDGEAAVVPAASFATFADTDADANPLESVARIRRSEPERAAVAADADAWLRAAAPSGVDVVVGKARLLRDPTRAARPFDRSDDASEYDAALDDYAMDDYALDDASDDACSAASEKKSDGSDETDGRDDGSRMDSRERVVEATGDLDVAALIASARRSFRAGRRPPPRAALAPEREASRFLEREGDDAAGPAVATLELRVWYSERRATNGGGISRRGAADETTAPLETSSSSSAECLPASFTLRLNASSAAPFDSRLDAAEAGGHINPASASAGGRIHPEEFCGRRVILRAVGSAALDRVDLAALVRSCAVKAPSRVDENARASTLRPRDRAEAERFARDQPPPDGWTLDGARWIEWDGTVSDVHPALEEGVRRWVEARNAEAREANARADETERARRPVAVVKDERYERRRYYFRN